MDTCIILDNIRSAHNVGSIFRTADGAGASKIYLLGYTPTPIDRFGRESKELAKTSLGAVSSIKWEHLENEAVPELVVQLKSEGYEIVAVEQSPKAVAFEDFKRASKTCFILGNEVDGVGDKLLALADKIVEIPMAGAKESLNVSVAAGIILFHL